MTAQEQLLLAINFYRKLHFFQQFASLTDEEIVNQLEHQTEDYFLDHVWDKFYGNGRKDDLFLLLLDAERIFQFDTEMIPESEDQIELLLSLAKISRGVLAPENLVVKPEDLVDEYGGPTKTVFQVEFTQKGKQYQLRFRYHSDWFDMKNLEELNKLFGKTGYAFEAIGTGDQYAFVMVVTSDEKQKMIQMRNLRFRS